MQLRFKKIPGNAWVPDEGLLIGYLQADSWNDYSYRTLYKLTLFDEDGQKHDLGYIKIANFGQTKYERLELPNEEFNQLNESFFSLGQNTEYYEKVQQFSEQTRDWLLGRLNDIVSNEELLLRALEEDVTHVSLLRDTSLFTIRGQYQRILAGDAVLTEYNFQYTLPSSEEGENTLILDFSVDHETMPPSNIHVIIGKNGVGKTYLLNSMIDSLLALENNRSLKGEFTTIPEHDGEFFAGLVSVSFSAFDSFEIYPEITDSIDRMRHSFIGLKKNIAKGETIIMDKPKLTDEFISSLGNCFSTGKKERWKIAIENLESDSLFNEMSLSSYVTFDWDDKLKKHFIELFSEMSSGHSIILLTMTKLVEKVEEKTLVLIDEPEGHLHPPLLSAFIRSLSDLLMHKNGVAIIATHSPVILQEVPLSCVWKFRRAGRTVVAERPSIETFGENVGILTREIFGLEVTESGYHQLLKSAVEEYGTYESVLRYFNDQLGSEARGIVRGMIAEQQSDEW